jgi:uncharacterized protein
MKGWQITFFTQQAHRHRGQPLADWLVHLAKEMNLQGATLIPAAEGFGHHRRIHAAHFIELADRPLEVVMVVSDEEAGVLLERLRSERIKVFYVKTPAEFEMLEDSAG